MHTQFNVNWLQSVSGNLQWYNTLQCHDYYYQFVCKSIHIYRQLVKEEKEGREGKKQEERGWVRGRKAYIDKPTYLKQAIIKGSGE